MNFPKWRINSLKPEVDGVLVRRVEEQEVSLNSPINLLLGLVIFQRVLQRWGADPLKDIGGSLQRATCVAGLVTSPRIAIAEEIEGRKVVPQLLTGKDFQSSIRGQISRHLQMQIKGIHLDRPIRISIRNRRRSLTLSKELPPEV